MIALRLTVLTGFASLVYEVARQKYLAALLGFHGAASAIGAHWPPTPIALPQ